MARVAEYLVFIGVVTALAPLLGGYLARVFTGARTRLDVALRPIERLIHALCGIQAADEMSWRRYFASFVAFGVVNTLLLYLILRHQHLLGGGPDARLLTTDITFDLALNTAISFVTGTTWQAYGGESTLTYAAQTIGLVTQGFLAGASGLAVGVAFTRGFQRDESATLGNFWSDLVRALLWVLLPAAAVLALFLVWRGAPQTWAAYMHASTVEGLSQTIARGPVATLEAIKNLGTNGGGFFNVNGAHPFANPDATTNFVGMLAIMLPPRSASPTSFGAMTQPARRVGWMLYLVMLLLFIAGLVACDAAELHGAFAMEGKETRFGVGSSACAAAVVTSNGATGSFSAMHDSFTPIGILVTLFNMLLGEIVFGGLGTGLYGIVITALVAIFLGGLMVGRTPEFLGKSLGPAELKRLTLYLLAGTATVLPLAALACMTDAGRSGLTTNQGAQGLSEILYAYASTTASNGLSLAGLSANSPFYNYTTALAMISGRYVLTGLALSIAGGFASQRRHPESRGTLPADSIVFGGLVIGTAVLVTGLCYLPALMLGPVLLHFGK